MDIIDAHDILRPGHTNDQSLRDFLNSLQEFQCLANCNPKQLQQFSSKIKSCLNSQSQKDKYNGLCALDVLVQQCSPDYFGQNIGSFINLIANQVFKCQIIEMQTCQQACKALAKVLDCAPSFPEVSRQVSSMATTLITYLVEISNKNIRCQVGVFHCLSAIMSNYPGACGAASSNIKCIESMLVKCMSVEDHSLTKEVTVIHHHSFTPYLNLAPILWVSGFILIYVGNAKKW